MLTAYVVGDREVIARLEALGPEISRSLSRAVTKLGLDLQRHVQARKLTGQALRVRTGTLRSSINFSGVQQTATAITGSVGTKVKYAGVHEFGFAGTVNVRAHLRHVKQVFGRPIAATQNVRAHSRRVNLPERSFLRAALREMEPQIKAGLEHALQEALRG
jgi:phage gpG-like protein